LLNYNIGCKKDAAGLAIIASKFHMNFDRKTFGANGGFDPQ